MEIDYFKQNDGTYLVRKSTLFGMKWYKLSRSEFALLEQSIDNINMLLYEKLIILEEVSKKD